MGSKDQFRKMDNEDNEVNEESGVEISSIKISIEDSSSRSHSPSTPRPSLSQCDQPIMDEQQPQSIADIQQFEDDKKAIYKHPLFPLLALLLEKCEIATLTLNFANGSNNSTITTSSSASFSSEIAAFVQHQQRDGKPFLSDDPEVDALMIKAIQVLRIHLLELEKVSELCKDFCQRYITCLRTKMNSENLLRGTSGIGNSSGSFLDGSSCSSDGSGSDCDDSPSSIHPSSSNTFQASNSTHQTVYEMVETSQGLLAQPIELAATNSQQIQGSNQISQIGSNNNGNSSASHKLALCTDVSDDDDLSDDLGSSQSGGKKKQQKRGVLPKQATSIMRSWLFQHIVHPYPTEDEKRTIASQTNLTLLQVNNWFINARRRILQPMLDTANSLNSNNANESQSHNQSGAKGTSAVTKKLKASTRNPSLQRFWPSSIADAIQSGVDVSVLGKEDGTN